MKLVSTAVAGTLESSDVRITIEPGSGEISLSIDSNVINQYGRQIKAVVLETLAGLGIDSAKVEVVDKGALDCTIRSRLECAAYRAAHFQGDIPWGAQYGR
ncbi:MAG: citrate lyase acyl carrier protein [Treponema sp.]|nr:citrate lyase acyl carrier protein [Treponema sp.]